MSKFVELFGTSLAKSGDEVVETESALADVDAVGIYFSAHWCPPCRGFTPVLVKKLGALKEAGKKVAIVFASSDQNEEAYKEYFESMEGFYALPYSERKLKEELSSKYGVRGIPTLVFVDSEAKTITTEGRSSVSSPSFIEDFPYHPKPLNDLSSTTSGLNDKRCLIAVLDSVSDEVKKSVTAAMQTFAEEQFKLDEDKREGAQRFFTAKGGGPIMQIRKGCGLPQIIPKHQHELVKRDNDNKSWGCDGCGAWGSAVEERHQCASGCNFDYCEKCLAVAGKELNAEQKIPVLLLLNLSDQGGFYSPEATSEDTITLETIKAFNSDYVAGKLERKQWK